MNADASRGLSFRADVGASVRALTWVVVILFVVGLVLLAIGLLFIVIPARRASR